MARVLVLNVKADNVYEAEVNDIEDFHKHLDSDIFDIAVRKIGNQHYDIFVDDIGLFREEVIVSAVGDNNEPMLVGNLIFANHDSEGNTTSLSDDDVLNILDNLMVAIYEDGKIHRVVKVSY